MRSKLSTYWHFGHTFCGIELTILDGKEKYFGVTAKKRRGEFTDLAYIQFPSLLEIHQSLPKEQHCFLAINSDKVLIKYVTTKESDLKTVSTAFPGMLIEEFYYEILKSSFGSIVAVCRKIYVQEILDALEKQNLIVLGFNLGITLLPKLTPFIKEHKLITPRYVMEIESDVISAIVPNNNFNSRIYDLENLSVASEFLLSVSMLFNYTNSNSNSIGNIKERNISLLISHQENNFFKKTLVLGIGFLLISLLINTFFFNAYFKKDQLLNDELINMELHQKGMEERFKVLNKKELLVSNILNTGSSRSSYYLNSVVSLKPLTISFSEIQYQPINKSIKQNDEIQYSQNNIKISGESLDKEEFSQWITNLGKLNWIDKVSVSNYGNLDKNTSSFSITIILKNDTKD